MMGRRELSDQQWEAIADLVPNGISGSRRGGRPPVDRRRVVNGIVWMLRTGAPWRDLPAEYGRWQTVWRLFDQWNDCGVLDQILQSLQAACIKSGQVDQDLWCIDGTVVRAARCSSGGGKKGTQTSPRIMH